MCGRYYIDDDTVGKIAMLMCQLDEKMKKVERIYLQAGDIHSV